MAGAGPLVLGADDKPSAASPVAAKKAAAENKEDVSPGEDLMREHGILKRILLIYGDCLRKLRANHELPLEVVDVVEVLVPVDQFSGSGVMGEGCLEESVESCGAAAAKHGPAEKRRMTYPFTSEK